MTALSSIAIEFKPTAAISDFPAKANTTAAIGYLPMPADFRYREVFARGKPRHTRTDAFRARHPSMDVGRRAKIFAPFDALQGFGEAVAAKDELYESKRDLGETDLAELNRRMTILFRMTSGAGRTRRPVRISVTYYVPCADPNSDAYRARGQYQTLTGLCRKVDPAVSRTILVDQTLIPFRDICAINAEGGLFEESALDPPADTGNYRDIC